MANPIPVIETFQASSVGCEALDVRKKAKYSKELPPATRSGLSLIWQVASYIILSPFTILSFAYFLAGEGVSWVLEKLARTCILQATSRGKPSEEITETFDAFWFGPITEENAVLRTAFTAERKTIITPDGVKLSAILYRSNKEPGDSAPKPTVICCNASNAFHEDECFKDLMSQSLLNGVDCNFITFNYRSVGNSQGVFTCEDDLLVDASSMIDYAKNQLNTPNDQIHLYGHSLGGAVALKTAAVHPELTGAVVSDRSFSSIKEVIRAHLPSPFKFLAQMIAGFLKRKGLAFDAASDFNSLKGRKLVIYHPGDPILPLNASVQAAVYRLFGEKDKSVEIALLEVYKHKKVNHHETPLIFYTDGHGEPVLARIGTFLFEAPPSSSILPDRMKSLIKKLDDPLGSLNVFLNSIVINRKSYFETFLSLLKTAVEIQKVSLQERVIRFFMTLPKQDSEGLYHVAYEIASVGLGSNKLSVYKSSLELLAKLVERGQNLASAGQHANEAMLHQDETVRSAGKVLFSALFRQRVGYLSAIETIRQTALNKYDRFNLAKALLLQTEVYSNELIAIAKDGLNSSDPEILDFSVNFFRLLVADCELNKISKEHYSYVLQAVKLGFSNESPFVKSSALKLANELMNNNISDDILIDIVSEAFHSNKIGSKQIEQIGNRLFAALVEKGSPSGYESGRSSTDDSDMECETETSTDDFDKYELPIMTSNRINKNVLRPTPINGQRPVKSVRVKF